MSQAGDLNHVSECTGKEHASTSFAYTVKEQFAGYHKVTLSIVSPLEIREHVMSKGR